MTEFFDTLGLGSIGSIANIGYTIMAGFLFILILVIVIIMVGLKRRKEIYKYDLVVFNQDFKDCQIVPDILIPSYVAELSSQAKFGGLIDNGKIKGFITKHEKNLLNAERKDVHHMNNNRPTFFCIRSKTGDLYPVSDFLYDTDNNLIADIHNKDYLLTSIFACRRESEKQDKKPNHWVPILCLFAIFFMSVVVIILAVKFTLDQNQLHYNERVRYSGAQGDDLDNLCRVFGYHNTFGFEGFNRNQRGDENTG